MAIDTAASICIISQMQILHRVVVTVQNGKNETVPLGAQVLLPFP